MYCKRQILKVFKVKFYYLAIINIILKNIFMIPLRLLEKANKTCCIEYLYLFILS